MKTILSIGIILLSLSSLAGCFSVPITPDKPNEYAENTNAIELLYGSTREEIIKELGEPEWIKNRNEATFFIYEWRNTDKEIVFMLAFIPYPVPVPVAGGRNNINWYCLLLEFNKNDHLVHHEASETSYGNPAPWGSIGDTPEKQINCLNYFKNHLDVETRPGLVIGKTKSNADDGSYEYTIEMLDKREIRRVASKHIGFQLGACVNVLTTKLDVRLAPGYCRQYKECMNEIEMHAPISEWLFYKDVCTYCLNAELHDADAMTYIGDLYYLGAYGMKKDLVQAYVWYSLAENNGNTYAATKLKETAIELSPEQLDDARHRLEQWEPGQCKRDLMEAITEKDE